MTVIKKVLCMVITAAMCLSMLCALSVGVSAASAGSHTYVADNFTEMPEDWALFEGSDTTNAQTPVCSNGAIKLHHNNPSDGTVTGPYWGAIWEIAKGEVWSDFTFEMDFTVSDANNDSRYINVLFHTQKESYLSGYGFIHKVNNSMKKSLQTSSDTESFDEINSSETAPLTLDEEHTMTITMSGNIAKYYLDGELLSEYDVSTQDSKTGGTRTNGGFAITLNGCAITISSIAISNNAVETPDPFIPYIGENGNWWVGKTDTGVAAQGETGAKGDKGDTGAKGEKGDKGDTGDQGAKGDKGDTGAQGIAGVKGDKGDTGAQGPAGAKGDTGATGAQGIAGDVGAAGKDGITPHIGENGNWWIGDTDTGVKVTTVQESGCGSSIGYIGASAIIATLSLGTAICIKKKKNNNEE